jgi:hypothetical protein
MLSRRHAIARRALIYAGLANPKFASLWRSTKGEFEFKASLASYCSWCSESEIRITWGQDIGGKADGEFRIQKLHQQLLVLVWLRI